MRVPVVTLVTLCSLIGYSAGVASYDVESVRELLAELREKQREELTVALEQQNETHQQQIEVLQLKDKALLQELELQQQELEIQQKANEELQATVYSLLKTVRVRNISAIIL